MSGPLLLGIAAVGIGWAYLHRGGPVTAAATADTGAIGTAASTVVGTVADETSQAVNGVAGVCAGIVAGDSTTLGSAPVEGSDGGQVIPLDIVADGQILAKADPNKSIGGADPSTLTNALHNGKGYDEPPAIWKGDSQDVIMAARYGVSGSNGMTTQQVGNAYQEAAIWSNEVF